MDTSIEEFNKRISEIRKEENDGHRQVPTGIIHKASCPYCFTLNHVNWENANSNDSYVCIRCNKLFMYIRKKELRFETFKRKQLAQIKTKDKK